MPELIGAMERRGHLRIPAEVRTRLLSISPATVDRLLRSERETIKKGVSTTRPGNLLKHQIRYVPLPIGMASPRLPGKEAWLHCGGNTNGAFLNTLVLVDIATGWLECIPLLRKSAKDVIDGLRIVDELLPFPMQRLDTDCGSEFINYELLDKGQSFSVECVYQKQWPEKIKTFRPFKMNLLLQSELSDREL